MKNPAAVLAIDFENDFVLPTGSLSVKGATKDVFNSCRFIASKNNIQAVYATLDFHPSMHISHARFWKSETGVQPNPFQVITYADMVAKVWRPVRDDSWVEYYLKTVESLGSKHVIWPDHCIAGTTGANLHPEFIATIKDWEIKMHRSAKYIIKGQSWATEQHSCFSDSLGNRYNETDIHDLNGYSEIYVMGEAYTHCVKQHLIDLVKNGVAPHKITVLTNCTSPIEGYDMTEFETSMKDMGMQFKESYDA